MDKQLQFGNKQQIEQRRQEELKAMFRLSIDQLFADCWQIPARDMGEIIGKMARGQIDDVSQLLDFKHGILQGLDL